METDRVSGDSGPLTRGTVMRSIADLREQVQKARIQFSNRLSAVERGADDVGVESEAMAILERYERAFAELELQIDKDVARFAQTVPACRLLQTVPGIGPGLSAKLVAMIGDAGRFDTVSKLWRYAGYACIDGKRETLVRGQPAHYNRRLKAALYVVATSFLRAQTPYAEVYYRYKERYEAERPEWTPAHRHAAAMRKMIKLFLSHLWEQWRLMNGLPIRKPYVIEYLGHTSHEPAEKFGWDIERALRGTGSRKRA